MNTHLEIRKHKKALDVLIILSRAEDRLAYLNKEISNKNSIFNNLKLYQHDIIITKMAIARLEKYYLNFLLHRVII